jgi:hypothetical protein
LVVGGSVQVYFDHLHLVRNCHHWAEKLVY